MRLPVTVFINAILLKKETAFSLLFVRIAITAGNYGRLVVTKDLSGEKTNYSCEISTSKAKDTVKKEISI